MKRVLFPSVCALLFLFVLLACGPAPAEQPQRELTVMVYMCGSNLESTSGSATANIGEMMAAKTDPRKTGLEGRILRCGGGADRP